MRFIWRSIPPGPAPSLPEIMTDDVPEDEKKRRLKTLESLQENILTE